jgi:hypothetical protein
MNIKGGLFWGEPVGGRRAKGKGDEGWIQLKYIICI